MPVCVECGASVPSLYTEYSKGHVVLTQCGKCGRFADKYIEFDHVIIFLDMVLHKPAVYRHLLFNRLSGISLSSTTSSSLSENEPREQIDMSHETGFQKKKEIITRAGGMVTTSVGKLCVLLILFDVYIKWSRLERSQLTNTAFSSVYLGTPFWSQYLYLMTVCTVEFGLFQLAVRWWSQVFLDSTHATQEKLDYLVMALIISSFGKLLHILMVIWDYNELEYAFLVNLSVLSSNAEAVAVVFGQGYRKSYAILAAAVACKYGFQWLLTALYDPTFPVSLF